MFSLLHGQEKVNCLNVQILSCCFLIFSTKDFNHPFFPKTKLDMGAGSHYNGAIHSAEVIPMGLFESDNIWKRKAREEREALHPMTPHEKWEKELRSNCLWLAGGALVVALSVVAVAMDVMTLNLTTAVVVLMVGAYCVMTARQIGQLRRNEPELPAAEKKKAIKRK